MNLTEGTGLDINDIQTTDIQFYSPLKYFQPRSLWKYIEPGYNTPSSKKLMHVHAYAVWPLALSDKENMTVKIIVY